MAVISIKILGWEKYNPRRDIKHPQWFAFNNRMVEDVDFYEFTHEEFKAWIYILSLASQKNCENIVINAKHALNIANISLGGLNASIRKLLNLGIISTCKVPRTRHERDPYTTDKQTDNTNITNKHTGSNVTVRPPSFIFDGIYSNYPRKEGKQRALTRLKVDIKNVEDFNLLEKAVRNYRDHCASKKIEPKFIKHFSTFVNEWRDWIDGTHGSAEDFSKRKDPEDEKWWAEQRRLEAERSAK